MHALEVNHLKKSFPGGLFKKDIQVLKNVSFKIAESVTTGFVGINGAGKTTTLKAMMNFIVPDEGEVLFFGQPLNEATKQKIGYLPERPYLYEFLTGFQFLKLHWDLCGVHLGQEANFEARALEVLERVNLVHAKDKKLRNYSKGMLQRIGIAQAVLSDPSLIIFDEPMSGLDPDGRFLVKEILKYEKQRGATIFFSSHLLSDMEELCQDIVVIDAGEIVYNGSLQGFKLTNKGLEESFETYRKGAHKK